jgi:hypothetical protein
MVAAGRIQARSHVLRGSGLPVSCRRTLAVAIVVTAALGEIFASPSRLRSAFYAGSMTRAAPSRGDGLTR